MRVRLCLSALTRLEFSKVVEVPDGTTETQLQEMVRDLWDSTDGSEFWDDPDYFEKGHCYHEPVNDEEELECG